MPDESYFDLDPFAIEEEGIFARDVGGQLIRLDEATASDYDTDVALTIDGRPITVKKAVPSTDSQGNVINDPDGKTVPRKTTIYDAAQELFVRQPGDRNPIPTLCHQEHMKPVGVCRVCVVEVLRDGRKGGRLLPSCHHEVQPGMEIHTINSPDLEASRRVQTSVKLLTEMLAADHLGRDGGQADELRALAEQFQDGTTRFTGNQTPRGRDDSSFVIAVDHDACILCDRCARACSDIKKNYVIGRVGKGYSTSIGFDLNDPMGQSSCVSCGECMVSCPTGALTFREPVQADEAPRAQPVLPTGASYISAEELRKFPLFSGIPYKFLQWNSRSIVHRKLQAGDILCEEGAYGSTAFILTRGSFQIFIRAPLSSVRNERTGGMSRFWGRVTSRLTTTEASASRRSRIRSDGGAALDYGEFGKPLAVKTPEDVIVGEMTCLSHYPRSATVVAAEESEVLEIQRNVLYVLQRNQVAREILDRVYRERALESHLRDLSLFADLSAEDHRKCVDFLRDSVELVHVDPGQVIFRQGEPADHFYMVRLGFVKVSQSYAGQQRVLNYLGPGNHFGEIGLLSGALDLIRQRVPKGWKGMRTATCSALDDVEVVRIPGKLFRQLLETYPDVRERLVEQAAELLENDKRAQETINRPLGDFLAQGLFNAQRLLVLDLESCTRCDECTKACADTHGGVTRLIRDGLRYDKYLIASSCRSCLDPYCLVGCPVDSIHREGRLEIVIEDHCIGCGQCARNCPYGNINMHGFPDKRQDPANPGRQIAVIQQKATTCDLCRDVVSSEQDPSCVYACPHNAAFRMSGPDLYERVHG